MTTFGASLLHLFFLTLVTAGIIWSCRWVFERSRTLGAILCFGVAVRVIADVGAFAISYFDLPMLRGVHTGDGFWVLALDARVYFDLASKAAAGNPQSVGVDPSPFFLGALAWWFWAAGASLLTASLFNLVCYVVTSAAIVWQAQRPGKAWPAALAAVVLASFAVSPILVMTGTQALKDSVFVMLSVLGCIGAVRVFDLIRARSTLRQLGGPALLMLGATCTIAGIRAYYAWFMITAAACGLVFAVICSRRGARLRNAAISATLCGLLVIAALVGQLASWGLAQPSNDGLFASISRTASRVSILDPFGTIEALRRGFVRSGGATNLASPESSDVRAATPAQDLGIGIAAVLVPISLLKAAGIVSFQGGRGLVLVADADTLFLDATLLAIVVLLYRHRHDLVWDIPRTAFFLVLVLVSGLLLAYVVTNYGTLFRLRLMVIVPAWVAPLALAVKGARAKRSAVARSSAVPAVGNETPLRVEHDLYTDDSDARMSARR